MNDNTQAAPQQTPAAEQHPVRQLCLTAIDQAIERHGMVKDKDTARELMLKQARQAGGVVYFQSGDADIDADAALRKLPSSVFTVSGTPKEIDLKNISAARYAQLRRSPQSEELFNLRRVHGRG